MKKEYIVKALKRIKKLEKNKAKLMTLGVEIDIDCATALIEEAIVIMVTDNVMTQDRVLDDIQWWLYERGEKVIHVDDIALNLEKAEDYAEWLMKHYGD